MAKQSSGLLGSFSGRIGGFVGSSWKGIHYSRAYVVPANPNTALQQTQRQLFADLVNVAKAALGPVLQVFWDPFLKHNSGWAHFIGVNRKLYASHLDYSTLHLCEGTLEGAVISTCQYLGPDIAITFPTTILGNGQAADKACLFVYDEDNKVGFFSGAAARSSGDATVTVGTGRTASKLNCFLFFADSSTAPTKVSYSAFSLPT